jgi:rhodanese-related sulfurtransferase
MSVESILQRALARPSTVPLLDTRPAKLYAAGHIRGSANVPLSEIVNRSAELPPKGIIIIINSIIVIIIVIIILLYFDDSILLSFLKKCFFFKKKILFCLLLSASSN